MDKKTVALVGLVGVILGAAGFLAYQRTSGLSGEEAAERAISFINQNLTDGQTASLVSVEDQGGVYKFKLKIAEQEYDSFVSKDGKYLFPEGYSLAEIKVNGGSENQSQAIPKSDKPDVKVFVMSYCPYGLQMQKAFIPAYDLLKEKSDMGVYFVNYLMHTGSPAGSDKKELTENVRQYCIQEKEKDKFSDYLKCFTSKDDAQACMSEAKVTQATIENCIFETDRDFGLTAEFNKKENWLSGSFPQFNLQKELNEKYSVQGSPTVVINDTVVSVDPRSPENFKNIICSAFNNPPEECSQTLSVDTPSDGFGGGTGVSGGSCE